MLDTHLLLWAAGEPSRLSAEARALIEAPENELLFSAASLWEIAIKRGLGILVEVRPKMNTRKFCFTECTEISGETRYLCGVPGDQLLQNLPRAEMQQGYVVVAVCSALFFRRANKRL